MSEKTASLPAGWRDATEEERDEGFCAYERGDKACGETVAFVGPSDLFYCAKHGPKKASKR